MFRIWMTLLSALLLATYLAFAVEAGWGTARCGPVGPCGLPVLQAPVERAWQLDDGTLIDPVTGDRYVRGDDGIYRPTPTPLEQKSAPNVPGVIDQPPIAAKAEAEPRPVATPQEKPDELAPERNFGVDVDKLSPKLVDGCECPRYWVRGKQVSREEAYGLVGKGTLEDDRKKLRLTFIGTDSDRARAEKDLPADLRAKLNLWSVPPDHWSVANLGYVTTGTPTVYLQEPSGKVLWRQDTYTGAADYGAIRKKIEAYDARKDPGPASSSGGVPPLAWLAGGAGALWLLTRNRKDPS